MADAWEQANGATSPLGACWIAEEAAYNFALYSSIATAVTLLLYGGADFATPLATLPLVFPENKTGHIWHRRVAAVEAGQALYYGYQVQGPANPTQGLLCDPDKVLLDPYARGVFFPPGFSRGAACAPGSNAGRAPLGVLPPRTTMASAARPASVRHTHDLVIYELHVRGFTRAAGPDVPTPQRGCFAGIAAKIPYLRQLGVTAVELMPVHQFDPQEDDDYWGYMTLNFFSPHLGYAADGTPAGAAAEFSAMVAALQAAGIEVFLDVVYNHTTEMGAGGPVYCFRGIDNPAYYALNPADPAEFFNDSACGNDMNAAHPAVRRLVLDSLSFWAGEMGVDGFRFDLASILARDENGQLNTRNPPIFPEITGDPALRTVRLIAEPWEGDGGGYLEGPLFPGHTWRQWNDHFRDDVRRFVRGDPGLVGALMTRLYGSTDLFGDSLAAACRRWQSVNYVTSHDGPTMYDLVAYTDDDQHSWNCGFEGDGAPPEVEALRRQQIKNFCCLLLLANGTPMFVAGDECLRTQGGNDNAWNQDNATSWFDWARAASNADMGRFFARLIALRAAHPTIGRDTGWGTDVTWYGAQGAPDLGPDAHALAYHLRGAAQLRGAAGEGDLYVMINNDVAPQDFAIQTPGNWTRRVDTSRASPDDAPDAPPPVPASACTVASRSVVVLGTASRPA